MERPVDHEITPGRSGIVPALGWGFYVACSWTWVIGMYLPVLLVRDYGFWGWVAFAVPNILGAAAVGWVFRQGDAARRFAVRHATATLVFSLVTVSFQIFVMLWLLPRLLGWQAAALVLPVLLISVTAASWRTLSSRKIALAVWLLSAGLMLLLGLGEILQAPPSAGIEPTWHLVGLAPVCVLGFLLCPYLDLTFLHARASTTAGQSRIAFGVGFGVFFLAMIVFTLLYALPLAQGWIAGAARWMLSLHMAMQIGFTIAAHLDRVSDVPGEATTSADERKGILPALIAFLLISVVLAMAALQGDFAGASLFDRSPGEWIYRCYMGCYGLLFPAYVLIIAIGGASLRAWLLTCLAAAPFFAVAFLGGMMPLGAAGVAIVIAAFFLTRKIENAPAVARILHCDGHE